MEKEIQVVNSKGLHGRPATVLAEVARKHSQDVRISYNGKKVNGKSMIALMSLAIPRNGNILVSIEGDDSEGLMRELEEILGKNYD